MKVRANDILMTRQDRDAAYELWTERAKYGWFACGGVTHQWEKDFAAHHQSAGVRPDAVACSSGTAALEMIFRACRRRTHFSWPMKAVVPTNTFYATARAAVAAGLGVEFADCAPGRMHPGVDQFAEAVARAGGWDRVGALAVVHVGGVIQEDVFAVAALARDHGVPLVEDAAHAHGCRLGQWAAGAFGDAAAFSFYATKVITTGEGGMVLTRYGDVAARCRELRDHSKKPDLSHHDREGYNWRPHEFASALGVVQTARLPQVAARRAAVARTYFDRLAGVEGVTVHGPREADGSSYYKVPVTCARPNYARAAAVAALAERGVALPGGVYETPLHLQPCFRREGLSLPNAEWFCGNHICLPVYPTMTDEQAEYAAGCVREVLS